MKRFLLFTFAEYYPSGGWNDFAGDFDTAENAIRHIPKDNRNNLQLIDSETGIEIPIETCPICGKVTHEENSGISGICNDCEEEGWWMDVVGGLHSPNEDDPAAMYE
jgi:hypothetical protein